MGVQLAEGHQVETEDVNFTDLEVSYHVRDALKSASLVFSLTLSVISFNLLSCTSVIK